MPLLSTDALKSLIENSASPCISIYMPMEKAGSEVRQNPIRFKNLMREAEKRLEEMGIDQDEARAWLEQANAIKKALLNFITELARVSKATNPYLANPKAWLF